MTSKKNDETREEERDDEKAQASAGSESDADADAAGDADAALESNEGVDAAADGDPEAEAGAEDADEEASERSADEVVEAELPSGEGPDPVIGAGITLSGIFLMAAGGARDAHYVFDVGVLIAVLGAGVFVSFVALSALKQRRAEKGEESSNEA